MSGNSVRHQVEAFLAGSPRHLLPAAGSWTEGNRSGEFRMKLPVQVSGEIGLFELTLTIAPDSDAPELRIALCAGRAFWRLCMDHVEHVNSFNRPSDLPAMIAGPHYHGWADNRHFGGPTSLPPRLYNARYIPAGITGSQAALDWFLEETNILPVAWAMPEWPSRTRLL